VELWLAGLLFVAGVVGAVAASPQPTIGELRVEPVAPPPCPTGDLFVVGVQYVQIATQGNEDVRSRFDTHDV
jgi:hypothetical protein